MASLDKIARQAAEQVLMGYLPRCSAENLARLKQRIARVRSGGEDTTVEAAALAIGLYIKEHKL